MFFNNSKKPAAAKVSHDYDPQNLELIFNSSEEGLILVDTKWVITLFNPKAGVLTGWPPNDATKLDIRLVMKLVDDKSQPVPDELNPINQAYVSKKPVKNDSLFILDKNNRLTPVSIVVTPIGPNGTIANAIILIRDIAKEKAEETRLTDFISTASHEMRTPVAAIEGYLELALNPKTATLDDRARGYLEKARLSTQHLSELFLDLLTSSKVEDGRLISNPKVIEVIRFMKSVTDEFKMLASKKGLTLEYRAGSNSPDEAINAPSNKELYPEFYIFADPIRLNEVLTNIVDNAIKYTKQGNIIIGVGADEQNIKIYVKDSGLGISAADIPHLFQKFYRVDNSSTRTIGGNGLGLYICQKIVELYGGKIWAESELGKGSCFYITIPRLTKEQADQYSRAQVAQNTPN